MDIKNFTFKHVEKFALGISACYLIYTVIYTFITPGIEIQGIDAKLLSLSGIIDKKLKTSSPPEAEEPKDAAQLELRFTTPPFPKPLQRPHLFSKFRKEEPISGITTKDLLKKPELQAIPRLDGIIPGNTEFILKGGTADLALIQVRKLHKDKWLTESFTVEKGEIIGEKKLFRKETVDFNTDCKLIKIIPSAQKPLIIKKSMLLRNEKGEFLGTSLTEEKHMISTSKIVFEDKKGDPYDLWIGELANLGTETVTIYSSVNISSTN